MRFTKLRGQHILRDEEFIWRIVAAAELKPADAVLEVGPGLGALTGVILSQTKNYVGVELDPRFAASLRQKFPAAQIVEGDILKINISDLLASYNLPPTTYRLISNLPYNITSAFLKKILTEKNPPARLVIMIQKEVAVRVTASERAPSLLGLMCNLYTQTKLLFNVPAGAFSPPPKVESAVIALRPYSEQDFSAHWGFERGRAEELVEFIAKFYQNPRKMMSNALGRGRAAAVRSALAQIGENPSARPADLSLIKWVELWKLFSAAK